MAMSNGTKIVIGGAAALLGYYLYQHFEASGQITDLATSTPPLIPSNVTTGPVTPGLSTLMPSTLTASTAASGQDPAQLSALLNWAQGTQNPTLYAEMVNQLDASDLASLYNILETQWLPNNKPTVAQTSFWNALRVVYPFLNTGGVGCSNLQCT